MRVDDFRPISLETILSFRMDEDHIGSHLASATYGTYGTYGTYELMKHTLNAAEI